MTMLSSGPRRLMAALLAVKRAHPYSESAPLEMSPRVEKDAAALWARLRRLSLRARRAAVPRLSGIELRLIAATTAGRAGEEWTHEVLVRAWRHTGDAAMAAMLWEAFLLSSGETALRQVASEHAARGESPALWKWLVGDAAPSVLAASAFMGQRRLQFREWIARDDVGLAPYTRFVHLTQLRLITPPMLERVDLAVPPATIDGWALSAIPSPDTPAWHRAYLETTAGHPRPTSHAVLERIVDEHGTPAEGFAFWKEVSPRVVAEVNDWLRVRQLAELLGGEQTVELWRRFLPEIRSIIANRDGRVVYVLFDRVVAAQFLDGASDVWLFPLDMLTVLRRDDAHRIRKRVEENREHALGRFTPRGERWVEGAESAVKNALRTAAPRDGRSK